MTETSTSSPIARIVAAALVAFVSYPGAASPQAARQDGPSLTCPAIEEFLRTAKVTRKRVTPVGVTQPLRATLDDGKLQHDGSIQVVDVEEGGVQTGRGVEANFRDTWKFNVAGYELAKLLGLNMVPPYVERKIDGQQGSLSWWIADAIMERDRDAKKLVPADVEPFVKQGLAAIVFHELIRDTDANKSNILITPDWQLWMIDFTRAFREDKTLLYPKTLKMCDRKLLANMRGLTEAALKQKLGRWLGRAEISGLLARRDLIVAFFDREIAEKGEAAVLYDLPRMSEPCGTGLR
jgi:hypothetical protein